MLLVLRALAVGPAQHHSVLLLLNGGEESLFLAAHAFAVGHRWAHDYRVVLNLEAIGAGGDPILFQMGPEAGWLAEAMRRLILTFHTIPRKRGCFN